MFLAAIRPPNNAETVFMEMKHKLYMETDCISAWALKPVIPLAFFSGELPEMERKHLPGIPVGGIAVNQPVRIGNQFCFSSEGCRDFCGKVSMLFKSKLEFRKGYPGVHIFDSTESDGEHAQQIIKRSIQLAEALPESVLNWRSLNLEIYKTGPGIFAEAGWWKRVVLETVFELSFPASQPR